MNRECIEVQSALSSGSHLEEDEIKKHLGQCAECTAFQRGLSHGLKVDFPAKFLKYEDELVFYYRGSSFCE